MEQKLFPFEDAEVITINMIEKRLHEDMMSRKLRRFPLVWNENLFHRLPDENFEFTSENYGFRNWQSTGVKNHKVEKIDIFNMNDIQYYRYSPLFPKCVKNNIIHNILQLHYGHLWLCGGKMVDVLNKCSYGNTDFDFFFVDVEEKEVSKMIEKSLLFLREQFKSESQLKIVVLRNDVTVSVEIIKMEDDVRGKNTYPNLYLNLQFILRIYPRIDLVLGGFDMTCAAIGTNGVEICATRMAAWQIRYQLNIIDVSRASTSFETRIMKYMHSKYRITIFPGFKEINYDYENPHEKIENEIKRLKLIKYKNNIEFNDNKQIVSSSNLPFLQKIITILYHNVTPPIAVDLEKFIWKALDGYEKHLDSPDDIGMNHELYYSLPHKIIPFTERIKLLYDGINGIIRLRIINKKKIKWRGITKDQWTEKHCKQMSDYCDTEVIYPQIYEQNVTSFIHDHRFAKSVHVLNLSDSNVSISEFWNSCLTDPQFGDVEFEWNKKLKEILNNYEQPKYSEDELGFPNHPMYKFSEFHRLKKAYKALGPNGNFGGSMIKLATNGIIENLYQTIQENMEKRRKELLSFNIITKNPGRQWTSSFNPKIVSPLEWIKIPYDVIQIGISKEVETCLRLFRLRNTYFAEMPKDLFNMLLKYIVNVKY
tara:strand:+ start:14161 stop:16110 length:1950 start_codon:yes stop_codon:yes gene_type:complete